MFNVGDKITGAQAQDLPIGSVVHWEDDTAGPQEREISGWRDRNGALWDRFESGADALLRIVRVGPGRNAFAAPCESGRADPATEQLTRLILGALGHNLVFIDGAYMSVKRA